MNIPIDGSSPGEKGASADTSRSEAASRGLSLPSLKSVVAELVANGNVTRRLGAGEVKVKATLDGHSRSRFLKSRVEVLREGKEQEDAEVAYQDSQDRKDRASGAEWTSGEIERIARTLGRNILRRAKTNRNCYCNRSRGENGCWWWPFFWL